MTDRFVANAARFPHETIDGETLLIDSETGHLLLLAGFASTLWGYLVQGTSLEALADAVETRFGAAAGAATRGFLTQLREAEIIVAAAGAGQPVSISATWPASFTAPALERYGDIADIIAMDPIHEVDSAAGWPRPAGDRKA
jgi:hypothetical protein